LTIKQDTHAAELLGWHKGAGTSAISPMPGQQLPWYWYDADGRQCAPCITDAFANMYPFAPSTSHEHARWLEDAIEARGLWSQYVGALLDILGPPDMPSMADVWDAIRATPEQRTAAFIATMEQVS
jgi:hypothetical protein